MKKKKKSRFLLAFVGSKRTISQQEEKEKNEKMVTCKITSSISCLPIAVRSLFVFFFLLSPSLCTLFFAFFSSSCSYSSSLYRFSFITIVTIT